MDDTQLQQTLQKGIKAARRGKKDAAKHLLGQVVQADPNNEQAWMWLARSIDEPDQKAECLQRAINLNPDNDWAKNELKTLMTGMELPSVGSVDAEETMPALEPISDYKLELLKCPNCHASLDLHGGDQVKAVVCQHCDTIIDLTTEQATTIGQANKKYKPMVPIKHGMEATIEGTHYQIIGWLRYEGWDDTDRWRWDEWLLGGADGEYRWLSYDPTKGFVMQKKIPLAGPIDMNRATTIPVPEGQARVLERSPARVIALAGELTWRAKIGDRLRYLEAQRGDVLYSVEATKEEIELVGGKAVPEQAIWQSFNNQAMLDGLQTIEEEKKSYLQVAIACLVLLILSCGVMFCTVGSGNTIFDQSANLLKGRESATGTVTINSTTQLHRFTLTATNPDNNWGKVSVYLAENQEAKTLLFSKTFGTGDNSISHHFRPAKAGQYQVILAYAEGTLNGVTVNAKIYEGIWSSAFLIFFIIICVVLGAFFYYMSRGGNPPFSHKIARTIVEKKE